jgi:threonylcarbamoyladenosine tRNA methylthiotransferase MtaB
MYKVLFITFGCKVNQYETECLKELFRKHGWEISDKNDNLDAVVINSCTVTSSGDSRVLTALRRAREMYSSAVIVLTGCYPQADPEGAAKLEEADIICGTKDRSLIPEMVEEFIRERKRKVWLPEHERGELFEPLKCTRFEDNTRAFVKIQDGCDRYCTYCIIPYARGHCRSKPMELLREEAEEIAGNGIKEIVLSGINLAFYGSEYGLSLADAAETAAGIQGIERVRLGSLEPEMMTDEQLKRLAEIPELCPQFHLSLQSGCTRTLKAMNRHYTADEYFELTERIRKYFPDCTFTTDIMVGFPGETDDDIRESAEFVKKIGFSKVHVFRYSRRPGTPADRMPDQIPESVKTERYRLMTAAADCASDKYLQTLVGRTVPVLFERENCPEFHQGRAPDHTLIKISRKNREKSLRNRIISVIIEVAGHDHCFGRPAGELEYD